MFEHLGLRPKTQKPDPNAVMACVADAVDHALQMHHEARAAIREGNGRVINMLNDALKPDVPADPGKH